MGCFTWLNKTTQHRQQQHSKEALKLVMLGLDGSGKTTTIASLQGKPPEGITPTGGFIDADIPLRKKKMITVFDHGGGTKARRSWDNHYAQSHGIIFNVDSADPAQMAESKEVLSKVLEDNRVRGKPILVLANKQDAMGALKYEEVAKKLSLVDLSEQHNFKYKVFPCSAIKGYGRKIDKNIKLGLKWLQTAIKEDFFVINEGVTKESEEQREREEKEKEENLKYFLKLRIRLLSDERKKKQMQYNFTKKREEILYEKFEEEDIHKKKEMKEDMKTEFKKNSVKVVEPVDSRNIQISLSKSQKKNFVFMRYRKNKIEPILILE